MDPSPLKSRRAQDPVSKEVLDPILSTLAVNDPECLERKVYYDARVTLASGFDPSKIKIKVSPCQTKLIYTFVKIDASYDANYVLGENLAKISDGGAIIINSALTIALATSYTANGCGDEEEEYIFKMPCKVEARGRNPETHGNWCPPSFNGFLTVCPNIHLSFLHALYFQEEDMLNMTHQQQLSSLLPGHQYYSRMHVLD